MNQLSSAEYSAKLKRQELKCLCMCETALKLGRAAAPQKATVLLAFPVLQWSHWLWSDHGGRIQLLILIPHSGWFILRNHFPFEAALPSCNKMEFCAPCCEATVEQHPWGVGMGGGGSGCRLSAGIGEETRPPELFANVKTQSNMPEYKTCSLPGRLTVDHSQVTIHAVTS